jgi:hypothetical protein
VRDVGRAEVRDVAGTVVPDVGRAEAGAEVRAEVRDLVRDVGRAEAGAEVRAEVRIVVGPEDRHGGLRLLGGVIAILRPATGAMHSYVGATTRNEVSAAAR